MEYIRDITLTLVVDTNKRTIRQERELESLDDLEEVVDEMRDGVNIN